MISVLSRALELRDEYTSHHQNNVAILSEAIARHLGMSEDRVLGVRLGALVHDIGKIAVPMEILGKPGKLNEAEFALIRLHPKFGGEIFRDVDEPWHLLEVVEQHHERIDGTGYPLGLKGDEICQDAKIVAVADTFDAMSSERPYRHAPGVSAALETLNVGAGVSFDRAAVEALNRAIDDGILLSPELFGYRLQSSGGASS